MTVYEKIEFFRKREGISQADLEVKLGFSNASISKWKKSMPKPERLYKLAEHFDVTVDFLMGKTDLVVCHICGFGNNPLSEQSEKEHEQFHNRFLAVREKYPFFMKYSDADKIRSESISNFRNPNKTFEEKISCFDNCLKASFSLEIARNNYDISDLNYEDFCKSEISTLKPDWAISEELIDILIEKYGVDREYMFGDEELLARVSNNPQLMRILSCAEKLSPELLNSIELQIKALVDNKSEG